MKMPDLSYFTNDDFDRGGSTMRECCWRLLQQLFFNLEWCKGYRFKAYILKRFGAHLGRGTIIKPKVRITFPWKLVVGENSWLGEDVWLLNLAKIEIGANVCISQRAFLCTGSHDWTKSTFDLVARPITIHDGAWICANVFIGPGVTIGANTVVKAGSVVTGDLPANMICGGNPCVPEKPRVIA